jgi:predicted RNase H-like HicB family nuclease
MATAEQRISSDITLQIIVRKGHDGYMIAECPDIPGCISQGKDDQEALDNLQDVVKTCLALIVRQWIAKAHRKRTPRAIKKASQSVQRKEAVRISFCQVGGIA